MTVLKRFLAWVGKLTALTAGIAVALGLMVIVLAGFTTVGSGMLSGLVGSLASTPGRIVAIDGLGPLLSGRLTASSVTIADERGVYGRADDLVVEWSPLALLTGSFKAERVSVGRIALQRKPITNEASSDDSTSSFRLPLRIDIAEIDLPSISLGSDLAGQALSLAVQGSLTADENLIDAELAATRPDQPETKLTTRLSYAPADNRLVLDGAYAEPKSGILGSLLRVPGQPAIDMKLAGDGPLSDWKGKLTASLDGEVALSVDATHRLTAAGARQIGLIGGGQFASLLPPWLRPAFAGQSSIDLSASIEGEDRLVIDTANLATDSLLLTASGTIDQGGQTDLKANLLGVGEPVTLNWPVEDGAITAAMTGMDLSATGPAHAVKVDLTAALESLETPDLRLDGLRLTGKSPGLSLATRSGPLDLTIAFERSRFDNPSLDRAVRAPMSIRAPLALTSSRITFNQATIESAGLGGTVSGQFGLDDPALAVEGKLFVLPAALPPSLGDRLTGMVEVAGRLSRDESGAIEAQDLDIRSDFVTLQGSASLVDGSLTSDLRGEIADIGKFLANATGVATFVVEATGPLEALNAEARVAVQSAVLAGRRLTDFELTAKGLADPKAPTGDVTARGTIDDQPIAITSRLETEGGRIRLPVLSATIGPNTLTGALTLGPDYQPSGDIDLDLPRIELIAALAGQTVTGDLKGKLALTETGNGVALDLTASGAQLRRDDVVLTAPSIDITIADLKALSVNGTAKAGRIESGTNRLEAPAISFARSGDKTTFDVTASYDGKPLATRGSIGEKAGQTSVELDTFTAAPRGIALALAAPTSIAIVDGAARFEAITVRAGTGTLRASGSAGRHLAVAVTVDRLPAALANAFAPTLSASGAISGTVAIKGMSAAPEIDYRLTWSDAAVAQTRGAGLPPLTIAADGRMAGQNLTLNANASGTAGLSVRGGGTVGLAGSRPLSLAFSGNVPLGLFAGQMSAQGLILEGTAALDVKIAGSATAPAITGRASLGGGRLIDVRRNLTIEALAATVALEGDRANITSLSGRLTGGGTISGNGSIDIRSPNLPADLTIRLERAAYADGSLFTSSASGDLALKGPLTAGPALSGALTLGETAITVPERLPAALSELDIAHKNAPADVRRQMASVERKQSSGTSSDIGLDLSVSAPSRIFVRGRGIDAELGGAVTIRGTASNPAVSGAFTLTRGRLSILTKRLTFTSGTITFGGNLIPLLNMEATTTSGSTTITVTISGLANDPSVSFSSSPALPQDEILAQLIFGQSMSKLSALQIAQLADAASQLAGGRSSSLFETLRSGLGVDNLDISTDSEGNAAVSAGKYLNDRTYIELQQSDGGTGKAVINLDIGKGVKLRGEAGGDGSTGAGIFYEKEY